MRSSRLIVLTWLSLLSLVATGWVSDHSTRVMAEAVDSLDHTREVLLTIDRLRAGLAEAESNGRGYVITDALNFGPGFDRACHSAKVQFRRLEGLTSTDPRQRASVAALETLVLRRLDLLRGLMSLKKQRRAQSELYGNVMEGTLVSSRIARLLDGIRSEELRRLRLQVSEGHRARRYAIYAPWLMVTIAALMFALMLAQVRATFRRDKQMREELRDAAVKEQRARMQAQNADRMKDQFLATVSHELRTPLTSIVGWCGLLRDEKLKRTMLDEGLANISEAARVQSQLVEDLLDVSRIVTGRLKLCPQEMNLADVVRSAIASIAPSAQANEITIRTALDARGDTWFGDPIRLQQVVWNLLSNSVKFTQAQGVIDVSLRWTGSHAEITVRDNGQGIAPDLLPFIFDRFRQGDTTGTRQAGLGLGLSIVKNLVELHGGTVYAESGGPGSGATFTVSLPAAGIARTANVQPSLATAKT